MIDVARLTRLVAPPRAPRDAIRRATRHAERVAGGGARLRVVLLFAGVEALASADQGTVGAVAPQLEHALHVTNGEIGVIAAVAALAGAVGTVPVGVLTDRVHRVRLLTASIVLWSVAMVASALAPSFTVLVLTRLGLGAVTATAGPTVASLIGDYFPARERAKLWGLILTGELIGAGVGVLGSGDLAAALSWRYGFAWLAIPGMLLALGVAKLLVEPARGGQGQLERGADGFRTADGRHGRRVRRRTAARHAGALVAPEQDLVRQAILRRADPPHPDLVLRKDPRDMPIGSATRYVLRIRTNRLVIVATALGYLFFSGVQTFGVLLLRSHYGLGQPAASSLLIVAGLGAVLGVVASGRLADRLLRQGKVTARVAVGAVAYLVAAAIFIPGLASPVLVVSMPLFVLGAAAMAAPNPPLNAARLDVMHPRLWGRAEGVRTVAQMLALAIGPLLFGFISAALGGPHSTGADGSVRHTSALAYTFLIMLVPLAGAGVIMLRARHTYARDAATAAASVDATAGS